MEEIKRMAAFTESELESESGKAKALCESTYCTLGKACTRLAYPNKGYKNKLREAMPATCNSLRLLHTMAYSRK